MRCGWCDTSFTPLRRDGFYCCSTCRTNASKARTAARALWGVETPQDGEAAHGAQEPLVPCERRSHARSRPLEVVAPPA